MCLNIYHYIIIIIIITVKLFQELHDVTHNSGVYLIY